MWINGFIVGATSASLVIAVALSQSTTRDEAVSTTICQLLRSPKVHLTRITVFGKARFWTLILRLVLP
jgi:hypothetical protein